MIRKNLFLMGVAGALSASAIATAPVQAESVENTLLISQLRGYEFFRPIEVYQDDWLQWQFADSIAVGRVKAKVGDICFVSVISPSDLDEAGFGTQKLSCGWETSAGDDVIMGFTDDGWTVISEDELPVFYSTAFPAWITRLDLKEEVEVQRTAIDWGETRQVELPPLRPQAEIPIMPEPIPGLW